MVLESSPTPAPNSNTKYHVEVETGIPQDNSPELGENHKDSASITKDDTQRLRSTEKSDLASHDELEPVVNRSKKSFRIGVTIFGFCMLVLGRLGVPEVEVPCVQDRVLDALAFANTFILKPGNEVFRDGFQLLCSIFVDITCLITFIYWIRKGTSYRLPLTLIFFYIVRALVQNMWVSPFTTGYYWESPGIPSLVVPYGRGSDFFFSGHTGFMVICALEWHYIGMKKVRNFVAAAAAYTMLILLVYRIHYSIDIFTGAIFAEWAFIKVDRYKHEIADVIGSVFNKTLWCFRGKFKEAYKGM